MRSMLALAVTFPFSTVIGAPKSDPLDAWKAHNAAGVKAVDHSAWRLFLARYVDTASADGIHRLRYGAVKSFDSAGLEAYLRVLQRETEIGRAHL